MSGLMDCMDGHPGFIEVVVHISRLARALGLECRSAIYPDLLIVLCWPRQIGDGVVVR